MEIHELNTKALTDPGYVAVDDGTDTYKADLNNLLTQNLDAAETYADSAISTACAPLSADIAALKANPKIWYGVSSTAASTDEKVFTIENYAPKEGDYFVASLRYGNTNTSMQFAINSEIVSYVYFPEFTDTPEIKEYSLLLFRIRDLTGAGSPFYSYYYVGMISSGGGGGTSSYSDLTNKPQINSVTLSGNKSFTDLGIDTYIDTYIAANYEDGDSATY